jgi:sugar O-acyltransferase (sialic acid O-acetyltransferase NeuD family)
MVTRQVVVIGFGGFGREVLDVIEAKAGSKSDRDLGSEDDDLEAIGVLDDNTPESGLLADYQVRYLGPVTELRHLPADVGYVIGIGDPMTRKRIDEAGMESGRQSPVLVHPTASVARSVQMGPGTVVCAHVSITNHIQLGRHVHVNVNSTIGHDAFLGDYVTVSPLVAISGNARLEGSVFVGTGVTINPGVTIGAGAVVGSGAAVLRDVQNGTTVVGVPAKPR